MSCRVLYIEDEEHLACIVKETMELKGYVVLHKKDGLKVLDAINDFQPDICVLDVMLPHTDGFTLGASIRAAHPQLPIIFLTAKSQTKDVLDGFTAGGTDYMKKPFSMEELMVRIDNQMRITGQQEKTGNSKSKPQMQLGSFIYTPEKLELKDGNNIIRLSAREAEILDIFCTHVNTILDRHKLMKLVWGDNSYFISRNLDVYIRKLRDHFITGSGVEIITLKGKGYQFSVNN
ncbi:response regulator transcription factor [Taibaiella soli]|uniref:DNA-binding response regulator n=1 Tax=Taibaiella soli TaxID=1649169 RepID=A0A2W2BKP6_9BACT|nr:response regulator transcription factor [Taibaiella soli]PZF74046.1 DNA-binding response regulator [Taibaiella soli]